MIAVLPLTGCGPKAMTVGSRPFPPEKAVFADASGRVLSDLPDSGEPLRLVLIDFPWCPPCADAWRSVRPALEAAPPGTVRAYRILFGREISIDASGRAETAPLRPVQPPWPGCREAGENPEVTTLTAIPGAFRETLRVNQAPMVLLIDREGTVVRRWTGYSTNLEDDLAAELRKPDPGLPRPSRR